MARTRYTPDQIYDLLTSGYPRHVEDVQVASIKLAQQRRARLLVVTEQSLWHNPDERVTQTMSLSILGAKKLLSELEETLASLEQ